MKKLMKNEGFTLVELIVVIAILGILAAVAVPAYTGYIDKANEAADTQVVSAMNTAFAAAMTENMVTADDIKDVHVIDSDDAATDGIKVTGISVDMDETKTDVAAADVQDAFARYFNGNDDTVLKYYKSFKYDNGNFTGSPNESADGEG